MPLLDTFVTIFEADTSRMKKGLDDARISTDDIITSMKSANKTTALTTNGFNDLLDAMGDAFINSGVDGSVTTLTAKLKQAATATEQLKKETESAAIATKKLDQAMGKSGETFQKSEQIISGFAKRVLGALGIALSAGAAISNAISEANNVTALAQTADTLGVAVEELDAFGKAAEAMGGDAQGARDSLTDMAEAIGEALQDVESGRAKTFSKLGISLKSVKGQTIDAVEGMLRLSDSVQSMSKEEAIFRIKEVGITDNRTVEMVLKGRKELEKLLKTQKEHGVITKENAERAKALKIAFAGLDSAIGNVSRAFNTAIMPAITTVVEWLTKLVNFARENEHFITGLFIAIGTVVAVYYVPPMLAAAAATLAAMSPMILIISIIAVLAAAFALVYDDIMNFIDGNDSMIGRIFEKYPMIEQIVMGLIDAFKTLSRWANTIVNEIADLFVSAFNLMGQQIDKFINWLLNAIKSLSKWGDGFKGVFQDVSDSVISIFQLMWKQVEKIIGFVTKGIEAVKNGFNSAKSFFGFGDDEVTVNENVKRTVDEEGNIQSESPNEVQQEQDYRQQVSFANQSIDQLSANPLNPLTSNAISNQSNQTNETNVQTGDIIINTQATDAEGMAGDAKSALADQLKDFNQQNSTGVAA
ncbi:MAG: hypothetical protein LBN41_04235 [Enterobacteriaceae bacterium]|jgi:hypothetical protein|nr:hypothetical protein [Enterobacteriaceae bacterium]